MLKYLGLLNKTKKIDYHKAADFSAEMLIILDVVSQRSLFLSSHLRIIVSYIKLREM